MSASQLAVGSHARPVPAKRRSPHGFESKTRPRHRCHRLRAITNFPAQVCPSPVTAQCAVTATLRRDWDFGGSGLRLLVAASPSSQRAPARGEGRFALSQAGGKVGSFGGARHC